MSEFATIEQALEDLRDGKIIVCTDDPDRENEGDFICAAEFATPENVNFMACYGKGLICMPMSSQMTQKLGLPRWLPTIQTTTPLPLPYPSTMWIPRPEFPLTNDPLQL